MTINTRKHRSIVVLGASSGIGKALMRRMAPSTGTMVLCGRDEENLASIASDVAIRWNVRTHVLRFEATAWDEHTTLITRCLELCDGAPDGVIVCHGDAPLQKVAVHDTGVTRRTIDVNFGSVVSVLGPMANAMAARGSGWIAAVSSVAGDRGRQSNFAYGSAKAGLTAYLSGLRNHLQPLGVHVLTIKPGFVDTPMLRGRSVGPGFLVATPERVAAGIERAIRRRRNVIYVPWFWRPIMFIIRMIPEPIFKRLRL